LGDISTDLSNIDISSLSQAQQQTVDIAQALQRTGTGEADPRFDAYRQSQLNLLESQKENELRASSEMLSRRGLGGTAAEQNAAAAIEQKYGQKAQSLSSELGLQSLSRQDTALQNALAAYGQSGSLGLSGANLEAALLEQQAETAGQQAGISTQEAAIRAQQAGISGQQAGITTQQADLSGQRANVLAQQAGISGQQAGITTQQADLSGQRAGITGQQAALNQQNLANQSSLLQNTASIYGQQSALNQQNLANQLSQIETANTARTAGLEALTAGLQNLTIPYALQTARTAAENAGESGDSGGGGIFGGLFG
jgi:hypothetical protein